MSSLQQTCGGGFGKPGGGIVGYPLDRLYEEVAYIAYHFCWALDEILNLEHRQRQLWVRQIAKINRRLNEAGQR
ncbi:MAG: hypothetical protein GX620_09180 [Chloroflexi bacterium]|nr:hypothetical protein [Chloroflexota bacterium]